MNKKLLGLYGLKWNPFAPDVPVEALLLTRRIESFCWRAEQLIGEGGFALVTGAPGTGKSATLRILADRLGDKRDVKVGILSRPQSGLSDFYREMGDLFGVELSPHNRWAGSKVLRERWQAHIDASLSRPVLIVDEAQEMKPAVLAELRLLSSVRLDSHILLTVVLAGDGRLLERLRSDELMPLNSRMRVRLALERASAEELQELLMHALQKAGASKLMTGELIATLAPLHDIGKVGVPDRLLNKPGTLTAEELVEMRKHPVHGRDVIVKTEQEVGVRDDLTLAVAKDIVYTHHEKWDGSGYPQGLRGNDIPIAGRLMALVDVYDAAHSRRVYQGPMQHGDVVTMIVNGRGTHFDPAVVDAFVNVVPVLQRLSEHPEVQ